MSRIDTEDELDYFMAENRDRILALLLAAQTRFKDTIEPTLLAIIESGMQGNAFAQRIYHLYVILDLALAALIGYLKDVLPNSEPGFADINDLDYKD